MQMVLFHCPANLVVIAFWYNFSHVQNDSIKLLRQIIKRCELSPFASQQISVNKHHGVGSNQFLSVNIGVIRLLSVITTTPSSKNNVSLINTGPSFRH